MKLIRKRFIAAMFVGMIFGNADAAEKFITVSTTTSTENSGLLKDILPRFKQDSGIAVHVIAQGTGQALDTGRRCDVDVVLVHDQPSEEQFVAEGWGVKRHEVMYNDFVLVGPKTDPAGIVGGTDIAIALKKIADTKSAFVSRGDDSGTHKAELRLWKYEDVDIAAAKGSWYRETGSGMGASLNTAAQLNAYVLTDRGTWISFKNRANLVTAIENDPRMFNQYSVILVNPQKCPSVKKKFGQAFVNWLVTPVGQQAIGAYKIDGQQLFFPNAVNHHGRSQ